MSATSIREARARRKRRIRGRISGTAARPRVSVFRSNKAIYAQLVDDATGGDHRVGPLGRGRRGGPQEV